MSSSLLSFSPEVAQALADNQPIVALESTIIAHGMPYPQNVACAQSVENAVRENGATPATIAVIDGKLKVGLTAAEVEYIGKTGSAVSKCGIRDLPFVLQKKQAGATTVSATMHIAALAGISIFATGGLGGVHRGASTTFDISADLQALANIPVAVVCAGAKSILDLSLTLEYLETYNVPVIGYQTAEFPAFYCRESGLMLEHQLDTPEAIAQFLYYQRQAGLKQGAVIANPIPTAYAMNAQDMNAVIESALTEMDTLGIIGKKTTPFLLGKIKEITDGKSLEANIALVLNNACLAASIASAY